MILNSDVASTMPHAIEIAMNRDSAPVVMAVSKSCDTI